VTQRDPDRGARAARARTTRVREGIGLFAMDERGLLEVRGSDRIRWLDGMITGDVKALEKRGTGAGCHALLLTHRGAIVADLHVAFMGETLLLECPKHDVDRIRTALEKRIIADDVTLGDVSEKYCVIGIEGVRSGEVVARALAGAVLPSADGWAEASVAGAAVLIAAFGWSGEQAYQLRTTPETAVGLRAALESAAASLGVDCVVGDRTLLEVLRIEAGIPALGAELDEDVLPPEARLERAVAVNKGCYVGQEIVARLRSRGQVNHLLVGLRLEGAALPAVGSAVSAAGKATGEVTSVADSPSAGPIALAYVRREHAEVGTRVELATGGSAWIVALPFVHTTPPPVAGTVAVARDGLDSSSS